MPDNSASMTFCCGHDWLPGRIGYLALLQCLFNREVTRLSVHMRTCSGENSAIHLKAALLRPLLSTGAWLERRQSDHR